MWQRRLPRTVERRNKSILDSTSILHLLQTSASYTLGVPSNANPPFRLSSNALALVQLISSSADFPYDSASSRAAVIRNNRSSCVIIDGATIGVEVLEEGEGAGEDLCC